MRKQYQNEEIDTSRAAVPEQVSVALGELAGELREGLLALAVGTGLQVMAALMEADVTAACGPRGRHDPDRAAVRHGRGAGSVTLGGRRVPVERPRMRATDGSGEVPVASYELFSDTEILGRMALERMLAGLSTRRYPSELEPVGARTETAATSTSRSAVSRRFVAPTESALAALLATYLTSLDLVALMVDGVHFGEHTCVVALGIDIEGIKHPLSLVEGSTENTTLVTELIVGLRERGLDLTRPILVVLDGSKALRRAVLDVFDRPVLARCQLHKIRNVPLILDVRRDDEYAVAHIHGALHIPLPELAERLHEIPDRQLWVHCQSAYRASIGASLLDRAGFDVVLIADEFPHAQELGLTTT